MEGFVRKNGIPPYKQVEEYLRKKILQSEIGSGDKLPTERDLAAELKVSRNTISSAYRLLEKEGIIFSSQGRGTFVKNELAVPVSSRKEQVLEAIIQAMDTAVELGFSLEQFSSFVNLKIHEYQVTSRKVNIVVVDCNHEQASHFARQLQNDPLVSVQVILLHELPGLRNAALVQSADLVVTTMRHEQDVCSLVSGKEVMAAATTPHLESLVKIAAMVRERTGLVCSGPRFHEIFLATLAKSGISAENIVCHANPESLDDFIHRFGQLIVTPLFEKTVRSYLRPIDKHYIVPFHYELDAGSAKAIARRIAELKALKRKAGSRE